MSLTKTKAQVLAGALLAVLVAVGGLVKLFCFPSAREADFALNERSLQQLRPGLLVVQPTRFARLHFHGVVSTAVRVGGKPVERLVGRNVSLEQLMAIAYDWRVDRVVLAPEASKAHYDFLVTARRQPREQLREAIRKQLGLLARVEAHDADVLALRVADASLPGLTLSAADAKENVESKDGKLCFTHVRLGELTGGLEARLQMPVVDKTGLTNPYDFFLAWDAELKTEQALRKDASPRTALEAILKGWGLSLAPDTAKLDILVVQKVK